MNFFTDAAQGLPDRPGEQGGSGPHRSQHCVLLAVDVAGFTDRSRNDRAQLAVRDALYRLVPESFEECLPGWDDCLHEDRGDGMLVVIPARMPSITVADPLPDRLARRLRRHNRSVPGPHTVRLRMAVHIGEVHRDAHGLAGTAVNHLFRLLDAPALKRALADSGDDLALIASDYFYDSVVRHADAVTGRAAFWPAVVTVKETRARGWIHLPQSPDGTPALRASAEAHGSAVHTPGTQNATGQTMDAPGAARAVAAQDVSVPDTGTWDAAAAASGEAHSAAVPEAPGTAVRTRDSPSAEVRAAQTHAVDVREGEDADARPAGGAPSAAPADPGARSPGIAFYGAVTVHGDVVAGNKIVYGDG